MDKTPVRRTFSADPSKCPKQILQPKHWNDDGSCKCEENDKKLREEQSATRVKHVTNILGGAWSALELLTVGELMTLEKEQSTLSNLQQSLENQARYTAITIFIRTAREYRQR